MLRKITIPILAVAALLLPIATAAPAYAHGWVSNPPSRAALCAQGVVENCGAIQWEPQSVEGPGGFPTGGPPDGYLCSGGNERFHELDDPRGGNWPTTSLNAGQTYTFTWTLTARHATANFRYYITKDGWNPAQPLTRADLVLEPFAYVDYTGQQPPSTVTHNLTLPAGKSGQHLIFAVWEIADTINAFYQCIDVQFGGDGGDGDGDGDTDPPPSACDAPAWQPDTVYTDGDVVSYEGHEWEAKWWTKREPSGYQWGPWKDLGPCSS